MGEEEGRAETGTRRFFGFRQRCEYSARWGGGTGRNISIGGRGMAGSQERIRRWRRTTQQRGVGGGGEEEEERVVQAGVRLGRSPFGCEVSLVQMGGLYAGLVRVGFIFLE